MTGLEAKPDRELVAPKPDPLVISVLTDEAGKRHRLRTILSLLHLRSQGLAPLGRVQPAFDLLRITACGRAGSEAIS
jgi:hypothetical protein